MNAVARWHDWFPLFTAVIGLLVGALVSEVHVALAGARERRRALNVLLFDLLHLRHDVRISNPRIVLDSLLRVAEKKFGAAAAQFFRSPQFNTIIGSIQKEAVRSDRGKLAERYEQALRALIPFDPMLAYKLTGSTAIAKLERAIALYYEKVAQNPDVAKDPNAPALLKLMENETTNALMDEVLKDLADDVRYVARARRWAMFRWAWTPMAVRRLLLRQDRALSPELEQGIEGFIERILPQMLVVLDQALQGRQQSGAT